MKVIGLLHLVALQIVLSALISLTCTEIIDYDKDLREHIENDNNDNDDNIKLYDQEYFIIKVPVTKAAPGRNKRFILSAISGVTAFVVKSGIWSAFKFSCLEFLKYTGGAIIGELYDKWSKMSTRSRRDLSRLEITADEFADGCDNLYECYSPDLNTTQSKVFQEVEHINKGTCNQQGLIPIHGLGRDVNVPAKFYQHAFRNQCFFKELICFIPMEYYFVESYGNLLGCGECANLIIDIKFAIYNVTNNLDARFCNYINTAGLPAVPPRKFKSKMVLWWEYELRDTISRQIKPIPNIIIKVVRKSIAINVFDNDIALQNILN